MARRWGGCTVVLLLVAMAGGCGSTDRAVRDHLAADDPPAAAPTEAGTPADAVPDDGSGDDAGGAPEPGSADDPLAALDQGFAFTLVYEPGAEPDGGGALLTIEQAESLADVSIEGSVDGDGDLAVTVEAEGQDLEVVRSGEETVAQGSMLGIEGWATVPPELLPDVLPLPGIDPRPLLARVAEAEPTTTPGGDEGSDVLELPVPGAAADPGGTGDPDPTLDEPISGLVDLFASEEQAEATLAGTGDVHLGVLYVTYALPTSVELTVDGDGTPTTMAATYPLGLHATWALDPGGADDVELPGAAAELSQDDLRTG